MELCSYKEKAALEVKELSSIFPNKNNVKMKKKKFVQLIIFWAGMG